MRKTTKGVLLAAVALAVGAGIAYTGPRGAVSLRPVTKSSYPGVEIGEPPGGRDQGAGSWGFEVRLASGVCEEGRSLTLVGWIQEVDPPTFDDAAEPVPGKARMVKREITMDLGDKSVRVLDRSGRDLPPGAVRKRLRKPTPVVLCEGCKPPARILAVFGKEALIVVKQSPKPETRPDGVLDRVPLEPESKLRGGSGGR
jgi:hypothetical protein